MDAAASEGKIMKSQIDGNVLELLTPAVLQNG